MILKRPCPGRGADVDRAGHQPQTVQVRIRTPLPPEDTQALRDSLAWQHEARSRQAGMNLMVEGRLIRWLAEATDQS